jgi:hypothetical protein
MNNLTSKLRDKVDLYGKIQAENELGEVEYSYGKIKPMFVNIIPTNLTGTIKEGQANTRYAEVTHKIKCRKLSIKDLSIDMYFIDEDGLRYDVLYFQPDYQYKEFWEIMCKIIYE